jgi:tryptophan synthase alpha chain
MREEEQNGKLILFFTAGYPRSEDTGRLLLAAQQAGADAVEVGIPFSDPMADGPVIQASSQKALANGMTLRKLLEQLKEFRTELRIPVYLMGYLNPVHRFGMEAFLKEAREAGVRGTIFPDLPLELWERSYRDAYREAGMENVFMVTPRTSEERIHPMDRASEGFLYFVADHSVTGGKGSFGAGQEAYLERIRGLELRSMKYIGFGIRDADGYEKACYYGDGAIVGTALIGELEREGSIEANVERVVGRLKTKSYDRTIG